MECLAFVKMNILGGVFHTIYFKDDHIFFHISIFNPLSAFFETWSDTVKKKELWRKNIKAEISLTYWSTSSLFFSVTFFYCYPYSNAFNAAWYIFFHASNSEHSLIDGYQCLFSVSGFSGIRLKQKFPLVFLVWKVNLYLYLMFRCHSFIFLKFFFSDFLSDWYYLELFSILFLMQFKEPKVYVHGNIKDRDILSSKWPGCNWFVFLYVTYYVSFCHLFLFFSMVKSNRIYSHFLLHKLT